MQQGGAMRCFLGSLFLLSAVIAFAQNSTTKSAADEQAIRQLNDQWIKAYDAADIKTLDRVEDDSFTVASEYDLENKQHQLDFVRQRAAQTDVIRKTENQQVRFYGDVALVTETDSTSSAEGKGTYHTTSMWVRRGSTWKVVHLHYCAAAKN
jgi:ketosteroid isomerase-like protein